MSTRTKRLIMGLGIVALVFIPNVWVNGIIALGLIYLLYKDN